MKKNFKNNVNQKSKEEKIEVEGKVIEVLKGSDYLVELQNGFTVARRSGHSFHRAAGPDTYCKTAGPAPPALERS